MNKNSGQLLEKLLLLPNSQPEAVGLDLTAIVDRQVFSNVLRPLVAKGKTTSKRQNRASLDQENQFYLSIWDPKDIKRLKLLWLYRTRVAPDVLRRSAKNE